MGKLPEDLKTAYDELYDKIQAQKESAPVIANRAFQWIMCSQSPLSPAELVAAVCQDPDTDEIDAVDVDIGFVLESCQNLLTIDRERGRIRFSHLSVQEYFETHHWNYSEVNGLTAKVCLTLLNHCTLIKKRDTQPMNQGTRNDSIDHLAKYARLYWAAHIRDHGEENIDPRLTLFLKKFLGSMDKSSVAYRLWVSQVTMDRTDGTYDMFSLFRNLYPASLSCLAIIMFGFHKVILDWWTVGFSNINQRNQLNYTLLQLGILGGNEVMVKLLIGKGAEINTQGVQYRTALILAVRLDNEAIVKNLLDKGADVKGQDDGQIALEMASIRGNKNIVRLLLEAMKNVDAPKKYYGEILPTVFFHGHEDVVRLFLEIIRDIDIPNKYYADALRKVTSPGHENVLKLLLEVVRDMNVPIKYYGRALRHACRYVSNETVVRLLLEAMGDVNVPNKLYGRALCEACCFHNKTVVRLLLEAMTDLDVPNKYYGKALRHACSTGFLMEAIDVPKKPYGKTLRHACSTVSKGTAVRFLLEAMTDLDVPSKYYGKALQDACRGEANETVASLLLEAMKDIDVPIKHYGEALQKASSGGQKETVLMLLDIMKEQDVQSKYYAEALLRACDGNHQVVMQLICEAVGPSILADVPTDDDNISDGSSACKAYSVSSSDTSHVDSLFPKRVNAF